MERAQAELARGVERYIFRRVAADESPLLDDHTREIIAEAIAWAVTRAIGMHTESEPHAGRPSERRPVAALPLAARR